MSITTASREIKMIQRAILDSGIIIGSQYGKDQYSRQSIDILKNFSDGNIKKFYITNYVINESVNFLLIKAGFERAKATFDFLLNTDNIETIEFNDWDTILKIFNKYKILSVTDCSLVAISEKLKINKIFSFDSNFDSIKNIQRMVMA